MKSGVKVAVTKTWDLVQRHDLYSCPDTQAFEYIKGASSLLLHSKTLNLSVSRLVVAEFTLATKDPHSVDLVPTDLQKRLKAYIAEATAKPGILDAARHRFYFLSKGPLITGHDTEQIPSKAVEKPTALVHKSTKSLIMPNWLQNYMSQDRLETKAALALWHEKDDWFRWPKESALLQRGWTRHHDGNRKDCYLYDAELRRRLTEKNLKPDGRNNGPAILSFLITGGVRPTSGDEGWPIHHIYDGQARIPGTQEKILHAVQNGDHFTHSGGLIAAHPVAHFVAHQSELLGWLLRWDAFCRFKYDPNEIFSHA